MGRRSPRERLLCFPSARVRLPCLGYTDYFPRLCSISTSAERRKGRLGRGRNAGNVAAARKEPENTSSSLFLLKQPDCRNGRSVSLSPFSPPDPSVTRNFFQSPGPDFADAKRADPCSSVEQPGQQGRGREEKKRGGVTREGESSLGCAWCEREEETLRRARKVIKRKL